VPGLRERSDDILPLSNFFLVKYGNGEQVPNLSPDALTKLLGYEWPGNVRELENVIQRAVVLSDGKDITADHLFFDDPVYDVPATDQDVPAGFTGPVYDAPPSETRSPLSDSFYGSVEGDQSRSGLQSAMDANEFRVIAETLRNSRTRKDAAARLGISERTLRYKVSRMKDRGIDIPRRKWA
jgi:two-component system response regulator FlrC